MFPHMVSACPFLYLSDTHDSKTGGGSLFISFLKSLAQCLFTMKPYYTVATMNVVMTSVICGP